MAGIFNRQVFNNAVFNTDTAQQVIIVRGGGVDKKRRRRKSSGEELDALLTRVQHEVEHTEAVQAVSQVLEVKQFDDDDEEVLLALA